MCSNTFFKCTFFKWLVEGPVSFKLEISISTSSFVSFQGDNRLWWKWQQKRTHNTSLSSVLEFKVMQYKTSYTVCSWNGLPGPVFSSRRSMLVHRSLDSCLPSFLDTEPWWNIAWLPWTSSCVEFGLPGLQPVQVKWSSNYGWPFGICQYKMAFLSLSLEQSCCWVPFRIPMLIFLFMD